MKHAIIDLGSNTFHLIVVEVDENSYEIIYRERRFVHLAKNGVEHFDKETLDRALLALFAFKDHADMYDVKSINLYGTEAIRKAGNGKELVDRVKAELGWEIEIITGLKEAEMIYHGVQLAAEIPLDDAMIIDIGGGSVEFIIVKNGQVLWLNSFPVGISILKNNFHFSEPISAQEIQAIKSFLRETMTDFIDQIALFNPKKIIGASGTFEVIRDNIRLERLTPNFTSGTYDEIMAYIERVMKMSLEERINDPGIPDWRASLLPAAFALIQWIFDQLNSEKIYFSDFALKEGYIGVLRNQA